MHLRALLLLLTAMLLLLPAAAPAHVAASADRDRDEVFPGYKEEAVPADDCKNTLPVEVRGCLLAAGCPALLASRGTTCHACCCGNEACPPLCTCRPMHPSRYVLPVLRGLRQANMCKTGGALGQGQLQQERRVVGGSRRHAASALRCASAVQQRQTCVLTSWPCRVRADCVQEGLWGMRRMMGST